jgi:hypothetical protein
MFKAQIKTSPASMPGCLGATTAFLLNFTGNKHIPDYILRASPLYSEQSTTYIGRNMPCFNRPAVIKMLPPGSLRHSPQTVRHSPRSFRRCPEEPGIRPEVSGIRPEQPGIRLEDSGNRPEHSGIVRKSRAFARRFQAPARNVQAFAPNSRAEQKLFHPLYFTYINNACF